jgi:hypothetical protein
VQPYYDGDLASATSPTSLQKALLKTFHSDWNGPSATCPEIDSVKPANRTIKDQLRPAR